MKIKPIYVIGIVLFIVLFAVVYYAVSITGFFVSTPTSDKYDNFAKCLTGKGIIFAGTDWCHFCKQQKEMFGTSFQYINYKNCDNDSWCKDAGITGYPTWVFPNGQKYPGVQTLEKLAELSGCLLP